MTHPAMNAAVGNSVLGAGSLASVASAQKNVYAEQTRRMGNHQVFSGRIEVVKCANGYIVNIGRQEGYEFESFIANTPEEVNGIIQSQLVAFRLEGK